MKHTSLKLVVMLLILGAIGALHVSYSNEVLSVPDDTNALSDHESLWDYALLANPNPATFYPDIIRGLEALKPELPESLHEPINSLKTHVATPVSLPHKTNLFDTQLEALLASIGEQTDIDLDWNTRKDETHESYKVAYVTRLFEVKTNDPQVTQAHQYLRSHSMRATRDGLPVTGITAPGAVVTPSYQERLNELKNSYNFSDEDLLVIQNKAEAHFVVTQWAENKSRISQWAHDIETKITDKALKDTLDQWLATINTVSATDVRSQLRNLESIVNLAGAFDQLGGGQDLLPAEAQEEYKTKVLALTPGDTQSLTQLFKAYKDAIDLHHQAQRLSPTWQDTTQ